MVESGGRSLQYRKAFLFKIKHGNMKTVKGAKLAVS